MADMNDFLEYYGVKGMKWGVTRDAAVLSRISGRKMVGETKEDRARYKDYKKNTSRKERRADKVKAGEEYARMIIDDSLKNPKNFVKVGTPGYPTLMSGKEFVDYLSSGRSFNPFDTFITDLKEE